MRIKYATSCRSTKQDQVDTGEISLSVDVCPLRVEQRFLRVYRETRYRRAGGDWRQKQGERELKLFKELEVQREKTRAVLLRADVPRDE